MVRYEEKIARFAQDKKFLRLPRPVRGRADALCDACGSTQPRTLYGLTNVETQRHYFVGDSCLKELVKRGYILRRFGKQSGKQAYEAEMQLRTLPLDNGGPRDDDIASESTAKSATSGPSTLDQTLPTPSDPQSVSPVVLMVETAEYFQAFVCLTCDGGKDIGCGTACVPKYEEAWRASGASGLVLEKCQKERTDAAILCLSRAWQKAHSQLMGTGATLSAPIAGAISGDHTTDRFPPIAMLRLGAVPTATTNLGP